MIELTKVIGKAVKEEQKERMVEAAFIGYQSYLIQPRSKKDRAPMTFQKWLSVLGISLEDETPIDRAAELARAYATERNVSKRFGRRKPVSK